MKNDQHSEQTWTHLAAFQNVVVTPVVWFVRGCFISHHSDMQSTAQQSHCVNTICGHRKKKKKHGVEEGASSTCDQQFAVSRELTFSLPETSVQFRN